MISVVLPAYKTDFLKESVQSILNQTYTDYEFIIVNDNPGSKVRDIVRSFEDNRIIYYENSENIGGKNLILNWNNCLNRCSGEFVLFASDDDYYEDGYLQTMIDLTHKYPNVDLFHCRIRYVDTYGEIIQLSQPAAEYETCVDFVYQRLFWRRKQAFQEFFFRRNAIEAIGGFVDFPVAWYSDDATLSLLARNGVGYCAKDMFHMRMSGQNISTSDNHVIDKIEAMKQYVGWMSKFLPSIDTNSEQDVFMKDLMLREYRSILYDHYNIYLPYLPLSKYMQELKYIKQNDLFPTVYLIKNFIKKLLC